VALVLVNVTTTSHESGAFETLRAVLRFRFIPFTLCGVFAMHWLISERRQERAALNLALAGAAALCIAAPTTGLSGHAVLSSIGLMLGVTSVVLQSHLIAKARDSERQRRIVTIENSVLLPLVVAATPLGLRATGAVNPTYDALLYGFESSFGGQPSELFVRSALAIPGASDVLQLVYDMLPLAVGVLQGLRSRILGNTDFFLTFVACSIAGYTLYFVFPVAGVLQLFGDVFPYRLPPLELVTLAPIALAEGPPRNGMPSLHAAWAYLLCFNSAGLSRPWRIAVGGFTAVTLVATMSLRDAHWLVDLIVALPMAVGIQALMSRRFRVLLVCSALIVVWFALLRWSVPVFVQFPALAWLLTIVSTLLALRGARQLDHTLSIAARP